MRLASSFLAREIPGCPMLGSGLSAGKLFPLFSPFVLNTTLVGLRAEVKKAVVIVGTIINLTRRRGSWQPSQLGTFLR